MARIECPKCLRDQAWHEVEGPDVWLRCLCGLCKLVATRLETIEITHTDSGVEVRLPKRDTNLWRTLMCLSALVQATSEEVTESVNGLQPLDATRDPFKVAEVASYLTILKQRGLVHPLNARRGFSGGSTWEITVRGKELIGN